VGIIPEVAVSFDTMGNAKTREVRTALGTRVKVSTEESGSFRVPVTCNLKS
jgi:hypothetical protein